MTHADLTLVRRDDLRPPFADLVVDVALRNPEAGSRWLLLAGAVGPDAQPIGSAGVHSVEVVRPDGATVGRFAGNVPFSALLVPAGGELSLRGWTLSLWDEPPVEEVDVEVVSAAGVRVGGKPAAEWLAGGTWTSGDLTPLPVELEDARREHVRMRV